MASQGTLVKRLEHISGLGAIKNTLYFYNYIARLIVNTNANSASISAPGELLSNVKYSKNPKHRTKTTLRREIENTHATLSKDVRRRLRVWKIKKDTQSQSHHPCQRRRRRVDRTGGNTTPETQRQVKTITKAVVTLNNTVFV
ncbi:hypothetical protein ElyMa_006725100 [Elysia marginata]|uniref:Uncharacterized protein n=1 Tax=Elysia marginata TaxID=1093978 RepID=A0AAV4IV25_9GAST|nr:hypothetical protein ElyMa_006725100 [Elysia marginata]